MPKSKKTVAYSAHRKFTLARLPCPTCGHRLEATAVEVIGDDNVRLICAGCHAEVLMIEQR